MSYCIDVTSAAGRLRDHRIDAGIREGEGSMVRKHYRVTRLRMTRKRPKTPAPTNGWVLADLAKLAGLPDTTVRYYVSQRLIRPIELRGTATRYSRRDLMLLLGLVRLKADDSMTLADKKKRLEALGTNKLEQWLREGPLPPAAATALGLEPMPAINSIARSNAAVTVDVGNATIEQWHRIQILPGLELMLRCDAAEAAREAARRICFEYVRR